MQKQAESFGAEIKTAADVSGIEKLTDGNVAVQCGSSRFTARAVVLAMGSHYRRLGVPGEDEFRNAGAGVSYCGTCDAPFFRDKEVVSIGGGNTAVEETLHLLKYVKKATLIHRRSRFRADKVLVEELLAKADEPGSNLVIKYDTVATAVQGQGRVQSVRLKNVKTSHRGGLSLRLCLYFRRYDAQHRLSRRDARADRSGIHRVRLRVLRTPIPGVSRREIAGSGRPCSSRPPSATASTPP